MGLVNTVVPLAQLEAESIQWAREIAREKSDGAAIPEGVVQRRH